MIGHWPDIGRGEDSHLLALPYLGGVVDNDMPALAQLPIVHHRGIVPHLFADWAGQNSSSLSLGLVVIVAQWDDWKVKRGWTWWLFQTYTSCDLDHLAQLVETSRTASISASGFTICNGRTRHEC